MTPKEKAEDLVLRYSKINARHKDSIKCALIAVDEILSAIPSEYLECWQGESQMIVNGDFEYWKEVKQEIEQL